MLRIRKILLPVILSSLAPAALPSGLDLLSAQAESRGSVQERVIKVMIEHLGVSRNKVTENSHIFKDLGADSLDYIEVIMALMEEFVVEIRDDDLPESQCKVSDFVAYIEKKLLTSTK